MWLGKLGMSVRMGVMCYGSVQYNFFNSTCSTGASFMKLRKLLEDGC